MEGVALPPKTTPQTVDRPRGAPSSLWECDVSGGSRTFDPCGPPRKVDRARPSINCSPAKWGKACGCC